MTGERRYYVLLGRETLLGPTDYEHAEDHALRCAGDTAVYNEDERTRLLAAPPDDRAAAQKAAAYDELRALVGTGQALIWYDERARSFAAHPLPPGVRVMRDLVGA